MWYYLPKNLSQVRRSKLSGLSSANRHWRQRRFTLEEFWKVAYAMWFFIFLTFAVKIGEIGLFILGPANKGEVLKLTYPTCYTAERILGKKYHLNIWIDSDGHIGINERFFRTKTSEDFTRLTDFLQRKLTNRGKDFVVMNVDQSASMENVLKMITRLQKLGVKKIYFRTAPN